MQTLSVDMPQALRVKLQIYQRDRGIDGAEAAVVAALQEYFQTWVPNRAAAPLPPMYDAEDGPCEVLPAFLEQQP